MRAGLDRLPAVALTATGLAEARATLLRLADPALRPPPPAGVRREERLLPGAPPVRILVYTPEAPAQGPRPAVLHIHGGGYVIGDAELGDPACRAMAAARDCVVVSVDYRLAPETRFPGALTDCMTALRWLHHAADGLGIDPGRIAVAGESAGGGHAVTLALHARDAGGPGIAFLLLDAPMLDDRTGSISDPHPICGAFGWTAADNRFGWAALLGVPPGGPDVPAAAVPARAADLAGLPPTFVGVGALDLFLDENLAFARRLARAGVAVELHVTPGAYHGFGIAGPQAPQVVAFARLRDAALARALVPAPRQMGEDG